MKVQAIRFRVYFIKSLQYEKLLTDIAMSLTKTTIGKIACIMGVPQLLHRTVFSSQLSIVMYHGVVKKPLKIWDWCFLEEDMFRAQMHYIKQHFNVVPLSKIEHLLKEGRIKTPTIVVTFDDGYQNNHDVAFPILKELSIPATIYLSTAFVDSEETLWFCNLNMALEYTKEKKLYWQGVEYNLSNDNEKSSASQILQSILKEQPHDELLKAINQITEQLGFSNQTFISPDSPFRMLNRQSIQTMQASKLIEFGAHTANHAILSKVEPGTQQQEIAKSVQGIQDITGAECYSFAYPNGRKQDYDTNTIDILQDHGIKVAVTTLDGPNKQNTPLLELKRYGIGADTQMPLFQCMVHHLTSKMHELRKT